MVDGDAPKPVLLMAPNGLPLRGTLESVLVSYPARMYRQPDGTVSVDYTGGDSKVWDECSKPELRQPPGGGEPEPVYEDTSGNDWLESQLVPAPAEWQTEDEGG